MIALGWDPGVATLAWAALDLQPTRTRVAGHGVIGVPSGDAPDEGARLDALAARIADVTEHTLPDVVGYEYQLGAHVGIERDGGGQYATAALRLVHDVTGMIRFAARVLFEAPLPVYRIQPQTAKVALLGKGNRTAEKAAVQAAVRRMFGVAASSHESDAVAIAVATVRQHRRAAALAAARRAS